MADQPRSLFRFRIRTLLMVLLLAIAAWSIYSYWQDYRERAHRKALELLSPQVGSMCTAVCAVPIDGQFTGRFVQMNSEWLVLEVDGDPDIQEWIPRQYLLRLRVEP